METTTILQNNTNIYRMNYDFESPYNISDLNNKLFCTFTTLDGLEGLVSSLSSKYSINWKHYRNCILLTQHNELKQLNTKIHKIIEL